MIIKPLKRKNIKEALSLFQWSWKNDFKDIFVPGMINLTEEKSMFERFIESPEDSFLLGMFSGKTLVGFVAADFLSDDSVLTITHLIIKEAFRGTYHSLKLILKLISTAAKSTELTRIVVHCPIHSKAYDFFSSLQGSPIDEYIDTSVGDSVHFIVLSFHLNDLSQVIERKLNHTMINCPFCSFPLNEGYIHNTPSASLKWEDSALAKKSKKTLISIVKKKRLLTNESVLFAHRCDKCGMVFFKNTW